MWYRSELKNNAKRILTKNYWWIVLVTIIASITSGTFSVGNSRVTKQLDKTQVNSYYGSIADDDIFRNDIEDIIDDGVMNIGGYQYYEKIADILNGIPSTVYFVMLLVLMFISVIALIISIFLLRPISVGCKRWFLKNRTSKPNIGEVVFTFKNGYGNVVKTMFLQNLFISLWTLLFIIPGIIKSYEYRMVPYLLSENPNMDWHEALERSREMMKGNKWNVFVLDLSFYGWILLSALTFGILAIFYVNPYIQLTNAELYVTLCQGGGHYKNTNNGMEY